MTPRTLARLAAACAGALALAVGSAAAADDAPGPPPPEVGPQRDREGEVTITEQDLDRQGAPLGPARTFDGDDAGPVDEPAEVRTDMGR